MSQTSELGAPLVFRARNESNELTLFLCQLILRRGDSCTVILDHPSGLLNSSALQIKGVTVCLATVKSSTVRPWVEGETPGDPPVFGLEILRAVAQELTVSESGSEGDNIKE
eukprot:5993149-Karenia_brevis.AAC.1